VNRLRLPWEYENRGMQATGRVSDLRAIGDGEVKDGVGGAPGNWKWAFET